MIDEADDSVLLIGIAFSPNVFHLVVVLLVWAEPFPPFGFCVAPMYLLILGCYRLQIYDSETSLI